jgi:UDP-glucose 4-epimerase
MRILLTGGAGFIGSHIADLLVVGGHRVLVMDNLRFGRRQNLPSGVEFWQIDLGTCSEIELFSGIHKFRPEFAIHLAAIHSIPYCMEHPSETFASNVRGTEVLVRALEHTPVNKLVFASTLDVYAAEERVHREQDPPKPSNVYGLSKWLGENIVQYGTQTNDRLAAVSLRLANAFGPRETNPHFIPDVLKAVRATETSEIRLGFLGSTRDFVHVLDVAEAVISCLFSQTGRYNVFNVATSNDIALRSVVRLIQHFANDMRPVVEDQKRFRKFDRPSLSADTEKLQRTIGWRPKRCFESALQELVEREILNARKMRAN